MVYELRKYNSFDSFEDEDDLGVIAWETDELLDDDNLRFCGKLIKHVVHDGPVNVPNGIETLGYGFLVPYSDCVLLDLEVDTVHIPASVTTIEEGAFFKTVVSNIIIDPESTCGIIKENGIYTQDGKTLLWIIGENTAEDCVYVVPEGVTRIAADFFPSNIEEVVIPNSVIEMGYDEKNSFNYDELNIKAPMGSYAIEFAKKHLTYYEEVE